MMLRLFKQFITYFMKHYSSLYIHRYCVMLKSICTMSINDSSDVFARWRHSAMKFLNKMLMTVFSI